MRAMILAAGRGQRMRPLTDHLPKPLLSVRGQPLIVHHLSKLAAVGVEDVVINHAWLGQKIEAYLGDGQQFGLQIHYSPEPSGGLETAGGIIRALPLLGNEPFWVINGDIFTDLDFSELPDALPVDRDAHLLMVENPGHNRDGDFAVVDGLLRMRDDGQKNYTFSGIGLYHPAFFADYQAGESRVLALRPLIEKRLSQQRILAHVITAGWTDVGTPERLQQLERRLQEKL
ncbi:N-acetylmuramate alpha-1-phosphate uridylyltransferase MurU [Pseudidiomarina sp.]|uniref:N-acetylmuramate alpha-1-phosphate uridylyltransferase MurU n=1 Tax=Pseudidiomarina sp. TaxID=2081707 RepID=UPI00299EC1AA|nr:nucleotidyltransferase family protein [Pseudidiomarina sp.]MDX1706597.1 nucleotidyltransferase family protein [Pseudidiomarina sp.]